LKKTNGERGGDSMRKTDIALGAFILLPILCLIIPVPLLLLDLLFALNILLSMVILFNALFSKEPLDMSSFPTLLLLMTLFRLSLNVSSTRNILLYGEAGNVVSTFGNFVGGGNLIVGAIVFFILIIMQLLVINKGSERVSEVTARFTLDAMPGKQMAIDADLNTGAITDEEAKARREKIQEESAFFGSMDGATKYVKGDATAGLIITVLNFVGGIALGVLMNGMDFNTALQTYSILTIGDGLTSQIPSLMISLATGILVTKSTKDADIGNILQRQLFSTPKVLYVVGIALIGLGIFTPLNIVIFTGYGALLIITGRMMSNELEMAVTEEAVSEEEESAEEIRRPENVNSLLQVDSIELEFGYGIIPLADVNQGGDLLDRVVMIRRQIALELGCVVPMIRLRDNIQLNPNQYLIKIKGVPVSEGEILFDHYMAMNPGYVEEEISGIPTFEPSYHLPALWITESQRERAESLGYTVVDPPSIIATHLTEVIRSHLAELLTRQDVQNLINNVQEANTTLISELVPKLLSVGEIQKVLQNLLAEGISIRDLVTIFETLADYAATTHDTDILTEYVRQNLKRAISNQYFFSNEPTSVVTLDPKVEQEIMNAVKQTEQGSYLALDPDYTQKLMTSLQEETGKLEELGRTPIIITSPIVRMYFKKLTTEQFKNLHVLSYNEIDSDVELQSVGMVTVE
jgi:flagellar biosynthesis protein FlhA